MEEKIRIIICSNENGSNETVMFTQDFDVPAGDFLEPGQTIDEDVIKELDLPNAFPLEHTLRKS